ncbi:MAG: c-type cytochrome [Chloroflexi bacterium]|nr:c-type cytochrome [Chloroflexota bacterium]
MKRNNRWWLRISLLLLLLVVSLSTIQSNVVASGGNGDSTTTNVPQIPSLDEEETSFSTFLSWSGGLTALLGIVVLFMEINRIITLDEGADGGGKKANIVTLLFILLSMILGIIVLYNTIAGGSAEAILEDVSDPVETIEPTTDLSDSIVVEVRLEEWQAQMPPEFENLTNPYANVSEAIAAGDQAYQNNSCNLCHGALLEGNGYFSPGLTPKPVNLTDPVLMNLPFITDAYLYWRISEGGAQPPFLSAMPAWRDLLSEEERWQLVSYIRSQASEMVAEGGGLDQAAIAVAEQSGCFACHRLESIGRGGEVGPAWDGIGTVAATRVEGLSAEAYIRQSILQPGDFLTSGFEEMNVMPANFDEVLSSEEVEILVHFLLNLSEE